MSKIGIYSTVGVIALGSVAADQSLAAVNNGETKPSITVQSQTYVGTPDLVLDFLMVSGGDKSAENVDRTLRAMFPDIGPNQAETLPKLFLNLVELGLADDREKLALSMLSVLDSSSKLDDETFKFIGSRILDADSDSKMVPYQVAQAAVAEDCDLNRSLEDIYSDPACQALANTLGSTSNDEGSGGGYGG